MTTERPDLYAILGIERNATQAQISRAYRALLRRHHPDTRDQPRSARSDMALQQVLAAYSVLRDPARRVEYDREARSRAHPTRPQPPNHYREGARPPIVAGPVRWHPSR